MKILVIGGAGFIGSHIVAALLKNKHNVVIGGRQSCNSRFSHIKHIAVNYKTDTQPDIWLPRLENIDAVVNCIGILNASDRVLDAVHHLSPKALFSACKEKGIKHVVQISAKGTEITRDIVYSDTKKAADDALKSLNMSSTILRPSYVYSHGSYGGSSLFRGLAAMPFILPVVGKGNQEFQPILAEDIAKIVVNRIEAQAPGTTELDGIGPERITNLELLQKTRAWLGFSKGIIVRAPMAMIGLMSLAGNLIPSLPINRTTYGMMKIPDVAASEPKALEKLVQTTGIQPKGYSEVLQENPSFVQDRWHARLYLLKPLVRLVLVLMWLLSALTGIFLPEQTKLALEMLSPLNSTQFTLALHASIAVDIVIALLILFNWKPVLIGALQIAAIVVYTLLISIYMPMYWLHPFGPLIKNIPILVLILAQMAIAKDR